MEHHSKTTFPLENLLIDCIVRPIQEFIQKEAPDGVVLILTAAVLISVNSPWEDSYHELREAHLKIGAGRFLLNMSLEH
jgi:NhaA family Na+:H+ antiporter